ncbi:MAG: ABC transporter ATP-binding protein [Oscillatoria sp. PMC 1051.18]|nr:ABC transporter ATP-binding protein [Oscillatoria sp. PMC 1050.18]MEC5031849.1 ABC transporter ATP-binding protein [Oscillatoria sp. PMC 1051.18]
MKLIQKIKQSIRIFPALRLVWQSSPRWTIIRLILLVIQSILPLIGLYLTKLIVDTIAASLATTDKNLVWEQVIFLLILIALVTLATNFCNSLAELVNIAQAQKVTDYMENILHAKSVEVDLEYYENPQYHDTLQRAQREASYRPNQILNRLVQIGQNGLSLMAMVGLLLSLHWGVASVLFLAAIPAMLVKIKYAGIMYKWERQRTALEREAWYLRWLLTADIFAKEIRLFSLGNLLQIRFRGLREQIYHEKIGITTKRTFANFLAVSIGGIFIFGVYAFIVYQTIQGVLKLGDLVLYHQALSRGENALKSLLSSLSGLYEDNLFIANLYEFLELKPQVRQPLHPKAFPQPMQKGIIFEQVNFKYGNTTRQALRDINLILRPNETIALVGENGSGKTTLIKLLCRLYDPTSGKITIDGIDISDFDIATLRRQIGVIFQDYGKYHISARDNIWLGNINISRTDEKIIAAARQSGADRAIANLPQGYDTILGKLFHQGEELSIGQWQKIALARAFLRDSQIIVLDEPTSAMDAQAEYEVFEQFRQICQSRAAILISHRLSTVKMADRIYAIANGSIIESGTHAELMALGGTYAQMFETQARNYR